MYGNLAIMEMGSSLILFLLSWIAIRQSLRLRRSGTAERLHRKTRNLLRATGWLSLSALVVFISIGSMIAALPSVFWEDRLSLNVPLIGAPLLAIWFTTVPMLWGLRQQSERSSGPLNADVKLELRSRLFVLPYQATALGAATSFYFTLISPVPYDKLRVAAPLTVYLLIMAGLWLMHDGRFTSVREWLRARRRERELEEETPKSRTRA